MKKYLTLAVGALALAPLAASSTSASSMATGGYVGIMAGAAFNRVHIDGAKFTFNNDSTDVIPGYMSPPKSSSTGFLGTMVFGYQKVFCNNALLDVFVSGSYNTGKTTLVNESVDYNGGMKIDLQMTHKPQFGVGAGVRVGYVMGKVAPFAGLGVKYNFGRLTVEKVTTTAVPAGAPGDMWTPNTKANVNVFSLVPELGIKVALSENVQFLASVGYEIGLSGAKISKKDAQSVSGDFHFKKKPSAFVAQVGVQYVF